jgi:PncC family amidohydrolase
VLEAGDAVVVILPGPPAELQRLWPRALETDAMKRVLARTAPPDHRVLRFFGASESEVARALTEAGGEPAGVTATICARDFEIHVDLYGPSDGLADAFRNRLARHLFAEDERGVEELVLDLCRARGWTLATAESCTGGLVAARLTPVPGSSDVLLGAIVSYANEVKERELGIPHELLERHGAVSAETAEAMAAGVRERLRADVGVSVTGIAGPGGGTAEKPVGLVYVHAETTEASHGIEFTYGQDRDSIRRRATVAALHLLRRLLTQSGDRQV